MTVTAELMVIGTVHDYGDQALLLEFDSTAKVLAWCDALNDADLRDADLQKAKPATSKGVYLKRVTLSSTMGPGVMVDQGSLGA